MERYTKRTENGNYKYDKHLIGEAIDRLGAYENTGLTPEEIKELERKYLDDEHEYCGEYGTDECQFAYRMYKLQQDRNYWECEAKKWADQLAQLRYNIQSGKCAKCKHEDTSKCKEC